MYHCSEFGGFPGKHILRVQERYSLPPILPALLGSAGGGGIALFSAWGDLYVAHAVGTHVCNWAGSNPAEIRVNPGVSVSQGLWYSAEK